MRTTETHGYRCGACNALNAPTNSHGAPRKACASCGSRRLESIEYPEHEKLHEVKDKSQEIGFFIELLQMRGVHFMVWQEGNDEPSQIEREPYEEDGEKVRCGLFSSKDWIDNPDYVPEGWVPYRKSINEMLAEHFDIDYTELMAEKDRMLEQIRATH